MGAFFSNAMVAFVGLQHVAFFVLEAFLWTTPTGRKVFRLSPEFAKQSKALAQNQGLYNTFLAAGLFWSLLAESPFFAYQLKTFFLGCVLVAGVVGGATVGKNIWFVQALPAAVALGSLLITSGGK